MRILRDERGFLLLEVLFLSFSLIAFSSVFFAYRLSARMHAGNKARIAALYLAEEQIAYVVERGGHGLLSAGSLPWLGAGKVPAVAGRECTVHTELAAAEDLTHFYQARVSVRWDLFGKKQEIRLERLVQNVVSKSDGSR